MQESRETKGVEGEDPHITMLHYTGWKAFLEMEMIYTTSYETFFTVKGRRGGYRAWRYDLVLYNYWLLLMQLAGGIMSQRV
jgi:hypothetical protein